MTRYVLTFCATAVVSAGVTLASTTHAARMQSASYCLGEEGPAELTKAGYVMDANGSDPVRLQCPLVEDDVLNHSNLTTINVFGHDAAADDSAGVWLCVLPMTQAGIEICSRPWLSGSAFTGEFTASSKTSSPSSLPLLDLSVWKNNPVAFAFVMVVLTKNVVSGGPSSLHGFSIF